MDGFVPVRVNPLDPCRSRSILYQYHQEFLF